MKRVIVSIERFCALKIILIRVVLKFRYIEKLLLLLKTEMTIIALSDYLLENDYYPFNVRLK